MNSQINTGLRTRLLARNVSSCMWITVLLGSFAFEIPTIVLLWEQNGLTPGDGMVLQAIFAACLAVLEVPTGYLADVLARKVALIISGVMLVAGTLWYSQGTSFNQFLVAEIMIAIGLSFASGADQSLFYESLLELGRDGEFGDLWGRATSYSLIWMSICATIGGYVGSFNPRYPFILSAMSMLALLAISNSLVEPHREETEHASLRDFVAIARECFFGDERLRWLVIFPSLLVALMQLGLWLYQPYFVLSGIEVALFGVIFALFNIVAAIGSSRGVRYEEIFGERIGALLSVSLIGASYLLLGGILRTWGFLSILLLQWVRGTSQVVYAKYMNEEIGSTRRATILSVRAMSGRLLYALFLYPISFVADSHGVQAAFLVIALLSVIFGGGAYLGLYRRRAIG